jgi:hypothetical protein
MQYDKTRIAIRERDLADLLDLALRLVRVHWRELLIASFVGAAPFAILNYWLLKDLPLVESDDYAWYAVRMTILVLFEVPLAAAPATLYLSKAMFFERFDVRRMLRQGIDLLPQLVFYQLLLRALWMPQPLFWTAFRRDLQPVFWLWFLFWIVPYVMRPYLNEVILLEQNPLHSHGGAFSTRKRSKIIHERYHGDLFTRLMGCAVVAAALTIAIWLAFWQLRGFFSHEYTMDRATFTVHLPLALWLAAAFFNVVRFLSYLDLRIRREGWEVELILRAEAERLSRHQYTL